MISKEQIKIINQVYNELGYIAYVKSFNYDFNEVMKINRKEEKAHRGFGDWEQFHDTNATINLMAKYFICENMIAGSLLGSDKHAMVFTAYDMINANGRNKAKALGINNAKAIQEGLKATLVNEFRKLDYAKLVTNEQEQPICI
tara:strand:+ start:248 stop:679 length:432 start_codon:yes stop_codon:yes gene_type:complete